MKVHDVQQGSPEWLAARRGMPTASGFDRIVTAKTRKLAAGRAGYMHELLAAWLIGEEVTGDDGGAGFMARGTALEDEARKWYSALRDVDVQQVGFITTDDGAYGCSPDGLVGDDGVVEIKCPSAKVMVGYLLDDDAARDAYYAQLQGSLLVTGRQWADLVVYNPFLPSTVGRVERDDEYLAILAPALVTFCAELRDARARLLALGCEPVPVAVPEAVGAESETF